MIGHGYTFTITCPDCGGLYDHITSSGPSRTDVRAVLRCSECGREAVVTVAIVMAYKPESASDAAKREKDAARKRLQRSRPLVNA